MDVNENSDSGSSKGDLPDLDTYSEGEEEEYAYEEEEVSDKKGESGEEKESEEEEIEIIPVKKAKTEASIEIRMPSGELNLEGFGTYSSVQESPNDIQLFEFPVTANKTRKNSIKGDFAFNNSYYEGGLNYLAIKEDITQRRCLLQEIEIKVGEPEKKKGDNYLYFHAYKITILQDEKEIWRLYRRYQDFDCLNRFLEFNHPGRVLPILPPKNPLVKISLNSDYFLEERVLGLRNYVKRITESDYLYNTDEVFHFLFSRNRDYVLFVKEQQKNLVDLEEKNFVTKMTDFVSSLFAKPRFKEFADAQKEDKFQKQAKKVLEFSKLINSTLENAESMITADLESSESWDIIGNSISGGLKVQESEEKASRIHDIMKSKPIPIVSPANDQLLFRLKNLKVKTDEVLKTLERKSIYEHYVQSLMSRKGSNEPEDNEFSREGYLIEDTLELLKTRLRLFYSNFTDDFGIFDEEFKTEFKQILKSYVHSKTKFEKIGEEKLEDILII